MALDKSPERRGLDEKVSTKAGEKMIFEGVCSEFLCCLFSLSHFFFSALVQTDWNTKCTHTTTVFHIFTTSSVWCSSLNKGDEILLGQEKHQAFWNAEELKGSCLADNCRRHIQSQLTECTFTQTKTPI